MEALVKCIPYTRKGTNQFKGIPGWLLVKLEEKASFKISSAEEGSQPERQQDSKTANEKRELNL